MKKSWTDAMLDEVRRCYQTTPVAELAARLGKTEKAVSSKAKILGVLRATRLTEREKQYIHEYFSSTATREVAAALNKSEYTISNYARRVGLTKEAQYMAEMQQKNSAKLLQTGAKYRFKKGHPSHNKGKKMSAEIYEKVKHTMFQKGQTPKNKRAVGSERTNKYGYIEIKIAEQEWKLKHRHIWEQANGQIPKGSNIQFRDGNPQNCTLDNLYLIARSEQIHSNSIRRYPNEILTAIRRVNKLMKLTNQTDAQ